MLAIEGSLRRRLRTLEEVDCAIYRFRESWKGWVWFFGIGTVGFKAIHGYICRPILWKCCGTWLFFTRIVGWLYLHTLEMWTELRRFELHANLLFVMNLNERLAVVFQAPRVFYISRHILFCIADCYDVLPQIVSKMPTLNRLHVCIYIYFASYLIFYLKLVRLSLVHEW